MHKTTVNIRVWCMLRQNTWNIMGLTVFDVAKTTGKQREIAFQDSNQCQNTSNYKVLICCRFPHLKIQWILAL